MKIYTFYDEDGSVICSGTAQELVNEGNVRNLQDVRTWAHMIRSGKRAGRVETATKEKENVEHTCRYCGTGIEKGQICGNCSCKRVAIRKLREMLALEYMKKYHEFPPGFAAKEDRNQ